MADEKNNNGGNGTKLLVGVHSVEIEQLTNMVKQILDNQSAMFGIGGQCEKRHSELKAEGAERAKKIVSLETQTSWQWKTITAFAVVGSGWLGYLTRVMVEHFQKG